MRMWGVGLLLPPADDSGWLVEVTIPTDSEPEPTPEPDPEPEPELIEPEVVDTEPAEPTKPTRVARTERTTTPPAPSELEPAPGEPDPRQPAPTYRLPDQGEGGSIPVPEGRPPPRGPYGPGGSGPGTGGGGGAGTGPAPPPPVSVAAIKQRAKPIGDTDFVDARDDYPPEAVRQGIEGQVKVRLIVDATGAVAERRLVKKLGYGLDELAMRLTTRLRFEPAIDTNDQPVRSVVVWTFSFTLPR
ncbi:MAG TPA: energy transducer TonB [Kofleriaceae bacterium]|nr:energy transducer TonB [Kofleriaceae bacterium]